MPYKDPEVRRAKGRLSTRLWQQRNYELYRQRQNDARRTPEFRQRINAKLRAEYAADLETGRERARTNYRRYREQILARKRADPSLAIDRLYRTLAQYGLNPVSYVLLLDAQLGACAICRRSWAKNRVKLFIDHDHVTGQVRGLLCSHCNATLHRLETTAGWVEAASEYLRGHINQRLG